MSARYAILPAAAADDDRLTGAELRMLVILGTYLDRGNECFPSLATLGARCGSTPSNVSQRIKRLCELGYVVKTGRLRENGGTSSNAYRVIIDPNTGDVPGEAGGVLDPNKGMLTTPLEEPQPNKEKKADRELTLTPPDEDLGMPAEEPDFETWWSCWRKVGTSGRGSTKRGKGHAEPGWRAAIKGGADPEHLRRAVGEYLDWAEGMGYAPDKIKHPATWLRAKAWLDDLPDPSIRTMDHAPRRQSQVDEFVERANQRAADAVRRGGDGRSGNGVAHPLQAFAVPCGPRDDATDL